VYQAYFGLSRLPFENNPDPTFLYLSKDHNEVLAALIYFIMEQKGFALVCGDVGTGKSMLVNAMLDELPEAVEPIPIFSPRVEYHEILGYLAEKLGLKHPEGNILLVIEQVRRALLESAGHGKRYVLIIDEAHLLSDTGLEDIRLLSNIETPERKLLQILLVGQFELSHKLDRPEMRQLRQRIIINRFLSPLDAEETIEYVDHRLSIAGSSFEACFEPGCESDLYEMTGGVPRRLNQLCDSALLICRSEKVPKINQKILKKAYDALRSDLLFTPGAKTPETSAAISNDPETVVAAPGRQSSPQEFYGKPRLTFAYRLLAVSCALSLIFAGILAYFVYQYGIAYQSLVRNLAVQKLSAGVELRRALPAPPVAEQVHEHGPQQGPLSLIPATEEPAPHYPEKEVTAGQNSDPARGEPPTPAGFSPEATEDKPATSDSRIAARPEAEEHPPGGAPVDQAPAGGIDRNHTSIDYASKETVRDQAEEKAGPGASMTTQSLSDKGFAAQAPSARRVTVKDGDTLMKIAMQWYHRNWISGVQAILSANPTIKDKDRIRAGNVLLLPDLPANQAPRNTIRSLREKE